MKRILSLVLALSMVLSMFTFAFAGSNLEDVEDTEYEAAVSALVELGIVNGYEDGTYKPSKEVTRAEMAKFLVVSAGLEPAAELNKGATRFSDVAANKWYTGYINVAAEYGYINGYPDGTFAPDKTVTYAEAVTMAIRVLGYKSVVETKGTWPTNYIAKAQELKVLKDVKYNTYSDGAIRGNVAILMWNMLRTYMWDVTSENDANGLNYSNTNRVTMIDKYFQDYEYVDFDEEFVVTNIAVNDGKIEVTLDNDYDLFTEELASGTKFLDTYGRTVAFLYNEELEQIVMLIPDSEDKVAEGYSDDLAEDYNAPTNGFIFGTAETDDSYVTLVLDGTKTAGLKNATYGTAFDTSDSIVVTEVKANKKTDEIKVTGDMADFSEATYTLDEDDIVILDDEFVDAADIKVGDVVTKLDVNGTSEYIYVVARDAAEGSFDDVTTKKDNSETTYFVTIDGEKYEIRGLIDSIVELDEDGENDNIVTLDEIQGKDEDDCKYYDEDCTIYVDFIGNIVRIEFEPIEDEEEEGKFYVVTNNQATWEVTDKKGSTTYVELDGESYEVKSSVDVTAINSGDVVLAKFDSKDRVKEIVRVGKEEDLACSDDGEDYFFFVVTSGDTAPEDVLDDNNYIAGTYKVTSKTVVYTIKAVEDEDDEDVVDHFEVETSNGAKELEGVEVVIVAVDSGDDFGKAAYVFVWEDAKNTDKCFGIVDAYEFSKGIEKLTIDGTKYEVSEDGIAVDSGDVGSLVEYTENDGEIKVVSKVSAEDVLASSGDNQVIAVDGVLATTESGDLYDLERDEETYEDYRIIKITVEENDDGEYELAGCDEIDYSDISFKKNDVIVVDSTSELFFIIKGVPAQN